MKLSISRLLNLVLVISVTTGSCMAASDLDALKELIASRKFKQAQALAVELSSKMAKDSDFHIALADLARARGDQEGAIRELELAMQLNRKDARPAVALADIYLHNLELDRSLTAAYQAVATAPDYLPGRLKLVEILLESEQTGEADRQLKYILETAPDGIEVRRLVYQVARKKQDWQAAHSALEYVIANSPPDALLKLEMAEVLADSGQAQAARKWLENVTSANPDLTQAKLKLAHILESHFHDFISAIKLYREVLAADPENTDAQTGLDRANRKQRDAAYRLRLLLRGAVPK